MKRFATLSFGLFLLVSGSGCCCLGPLFGMHGGGYGGGGCQPCGGGAYGAGYQQSPCGPGGCGTSYGPSGMAPQAFYPGAVQQAGVPFMYQTTALNPNPVW